MTCIVGIADPKYNETYIGGDANAVAGWTKNAVTPKVWNRDGFIFGGTTSFRMMDILRHSLEIPEIPADDVDLKWMQTHFIDAVRKVLKEGAWMKVDDHREEGGSFLVGYYGRLYHVDSDQHVTQPLSGYASVGCGEDAALGSLYTTSQFDFTTLSPVERALIALRASATHNIGVDAPFTIVRSSGGLYTFDEMQWTNTVSEEIHR